jgi:hypothetical protein
MIVLGSETITVLYMGVLTKKSFFYNELKK